MKGKITSYCIPYQTLGDYYNGSAEIEIAHPTDYRLSIHPSILEVYKVEFPSSYLGGGTITVEVDLKTNKTVGRYEFNDGSIGFLKEVKVAKGYRFYIITGRWQLNGDWKFFFELDINQ